MRVRGDNAPSNAFSLEEQPNKPGVALVRFYENAEPFEEKRDELTISGWVYDEYHLELNMYDGLSEDILGNYAGYLAQAKLHEAEGKTIPSLQQQVADLETDKAALTEKVTSLEGQVPDTQMALCDVYEQIVAVTSTTGGSSYGSCLRDPDRQGQEDHRPGSEPDSEAGRGDPGRSRSHRLTTALIRRAAPLRGLPFLSRAEED